MHSSARACRAGCANGTTIVGPETARATIALSVVGFEPESCARYITRAGRESRLRRPPSADSDSDPLVCTILVHDDIGQHPERTDGWFRQHESFVSSWIRHAMRESNGRTVTKVLRRVRLALRVSLMKPA